MGFRNPVKGMTPKLLLSVFLIVGSVFNYGFDYSVYSTIQAMAPFTRRFGEYNPQTKTWAESATQLSLLNSLPLIPYGLGIIIAGLIGERFGRRAVFAIVQVVCLVGLVVSYTAKVYGQMLAGRMLVYAHVGMEGWLIPMYTAELVPSHLRGSLVVTYVFSHVFGSFIASIVTRQTSFLPDDRAWQIPLAVMFSVPSLLLFAYFILPESPRWLLRRGRRDDAVRNLQFLNGANAGYEAEEEADLMLLSLEQEDTKGTYKELFQGTNRRRTLIALAAAMFNQLTGTSFTAQYGTIFIQTYNTINPFTYTLVSATMSMAGSLLAFSLVDVVGRRFLYLLGGSVTTLAMLTMGGLGCAPTISIPIVNGIVACALIVSFFFIFSFGAMGVLTGAEVPALRHRDKTALLAWTVQNLSNFATTFTLPYLLKAPYADLQSKVGFIYGAISAVAVLWAYFCLPDMRGRSLEELDELFRAEVPARRFRDWASSNPNTVGAQLTRLEETAGHGTSNKDDFIHAERIEGA